MNFKSFIQEVKQYPELYDQKNTNYTYFAKKEFIWQQISIKFQIHARRKWASLRDRYVKHKKKLESINSCDESNWQYFEDMKFLDAHLLKKIKPISNIKNNSKIRLNILSNIEEEILENIDECIENTGNEKNIINVFDPELIIYNIDDYNSHYDLNKECKCGQVFLVNGEILLVCDFCEIVFDKAEIFIEHIMTTHNDSERVVRKLVNNNKNEHLLIETEDMLANKMENEILYNNKGLTEYQNNFIKFDNDKNECIVSNMNNNIEYEILADTDDDIKFLITDEENIMANNLNDSLLLEVDSNQINKMPSKKLNVNNKYFCTMCDKTYIIYKSLQNHFRMYHSKPNICNICGKSFAKYSFLNMHIQSKHNLESLNEEESVKNNSIIKTVQKSKKNTNKTGSKIGLQIFFDQPERIKNEKGRFICSKCNITYARFENIKLHYRKYHLFENNVNKATQSSYKCDVCNKLFKSKFQFRLHMNIHNNKRPYKCKICSADFTHPQYLNYHVRIHTNDKRYSCDYCDKKFIRKFDKIYHIRSQHTMEKPAQCDDCGQTFTKYAQLTIHKNKHHNLNYIKPEFICIICNKKLTTYQAMKYHQLIHTGEKPHQCNVCLLRFRKRSNLKIHEKIHWNIKEYTCNICNKKFTQLSGLNIHIKTHEEFV